MMRLWSRCGWVELIVEAASSYRLTILKISSPASMILVQISFTLNGVSATGSAWMARSWLTWKKESDSTTPFS